MLHSVGISKLAQFHAAAPHHHCHCFVLTSDGPSISYVDMDLRGTDCNADVAMRGGCIYSLAMLLAGKSTHIPGRATQSVAYE